MASSTVVAHFTAVITVAVPGEAEQTFPSRSLPLLPFLWPPTPHGAFPHAGTHIYSAQDWILSVECQAS